MPIKLPGWRKNNRWRDLMPPTSQPTLEPIFGEASSVRHTRLSGDGPAGSLPLNEEMLLNEPSGNLFGLTQNAGMGWEPGEVNHPAILILSTLGGLRDENGKPIALGYHTGHWELDRLVREAAGELRA